MWGSATLAMEMSSTSINAASATVAAISHGLVRGLHCTGELTVAPPFGDAGITAVLACCSGKNLLLQSFRSVRWLDSFSVGFAPIDFAQCGGGSSVFKVALSNS